MKLLVKVHKSYRNVVAICDVELSGKTFEQGNHELKIKEPFFGGDELSEQEALKIIQKQSDEDATFNIVGPNAVKTCLKAGIITEQGIKNIDNIPYAMVLL